MSNFITVEGREFISLEIAVKIARKAVSFGAYRGDWSTDLLYEFMDREVPKYIEGLKRYDEQQPDEAE